MDDKVSLAILGLSKGEKKVLGTLFEGMDTPLAISRRTRISRPAVYEILGRFKERGLARSYITGGKRSWAVESDMAIERALYETKRSLLRVPEGREELHGRTDSSVVVHRGKEAVKKLLNELLVEHKNERLHGFQGHTSTIAWNRVFSVAETNRFNRNVKKNHIIVEAVLPEGWLERQSRELGVEWARDFEGRTTRVNIIDPAYFEHGGQLWVFKESVYLMSLSEEMVIEIRNSEMQKMILAIFEFIQEHSRVIDANELLRKLIEKGNTSIS